MSHWAQFDLKYQETCLSDPDYDDPLWCAVRDLETQIHELRQDLQSLRKTVDSWTTQINHEEKNQDA